MVREGEVGAAALDVEAHAEVVQGDGDTLDVPAGPAAAQRGAVPARLAVTGGHPQHRVERVLLALALRVAAALGGQQPHRLGVQAGDLAEVRVGLDGEVGVAVQLVGGAGLAQPLHQRDDAGYRLDGAYVVAGRQHPQGRHVLAEQGGLALGERRPVVAGGHGPLQQRIVDIGDVLHVVNLALRVEPHALNEVERVVGRRVPHVGGVVRRDAADVDTGDGTGVEGYPSAGRGVVDPQVAALARQGGDLRSGPCMHALSVTGRMFRIRTGSRGLAGIGGLVFGAREHARSVRRCRTAPRRIQTGGQGMAGHSPLGSGCRPAAQQRGHPRPQRLDLGIRDQFGQSGGERRALPQRLAAGRAGPPAPRRSAAPPPTPTAACAACPRR